MRDRCRSSTKLRLVAVMLGRDVADVRASGKTRFTDSHVQAAEPVLSARSLTRRHLLEDVDVDVRPGEVVGLAGLLGSGRSETVKAIFGAQAVDRGEVSRRRRRRSGRLARPRPRRRDRAAARGPQGRGHRAGPLDPGEHPARRAAAADTRAGLVSDRKGDEIVEIFMRRLRIKAAGPAPEGPGAVGRQSAEGAARAAALPASRRCCCSTSRRAGSTSGRRPRCRR